MAQVLLDKLNEIRDHPFRMLANFYDFCPLPHSLWQFFITIRWQIWHIWQIFDPFPLKVADVPSQLFLKIDAFFLQKTCHFQVT